MRDLLAVVEKMARLTVPVCVVGETGTGKNLVARAIHFNSPRSDRPFVGVHGAAMTEEFVKRSLVGHARRAFSPFADHRHSLVAKADTGTLFIDHVAELPLPLQAHILGLVESGDFMKGGGPKPIKSDVRLITATNKDLGTAVAAGRFREDLYYSINVVSIHVPPLRERKEDIPVLANYFLQQFGILHGRTHRELSRRALEFLVDCSWPGNVRELEQVIERAVMRARGWVIDLPLLAESRDRPDDHLTTWGPPCHNN
jgi:DNA-binding NtrC family response regulator